MPECLMKLLDTTNVCIVAEKPINLTERRLSESIATTHKYSHLRGARERYYNMARIAVISRVFIERKSCVLGKRGVSSSDLLMIHRERKKRGAMRGVLQGNARRVVLRL